MEFRQINQVRVYKLILNPMHDRTESGCLVAVSTDYDKLVQWYLSQKAAVPYRDDRWYKVFEKGSQLEWYNPSASLELNELGAFGHGITDEWVNETTYHNFIQSGRCHVVE